MGAPIDQYAGHEVRIRESVRRRLQRASHLEETSRRQNPGHDSKLRRHLRNELCGLGQGRPIGIRGTATTTGNSPLFLAASHTRPDHQWKALLWRRGIAWARRGKGRKVSTSTTRL